MIASGRAKWFGLAVLLTVQFMVVLDIAIVNVALPSIKSRPRVLAGEPPVGDQRLRPRLRWLPPARRPHGRPARPPPDLPDRPRASSRVGSLLCGLAWTDTALIGARALQGLGCRDDHAGRTLDPHHDLPGRPRAEHRPRRLGRGRRLRRRGGRPARRRPDRRALVGVDLLRQRARSACSRSIVSPFLLGESRDANAKSFDAIGAVLVTGGLSLLVLAITQAHAWGWDSAADDRHLLVSGLLLVGFVVWEQRVEDPLMRFSIFRVRTVLGANIAGLHPRHGAIRDVPDADALHAAGAPLLADEDRCRLPRGRRNVDHLGERRRRARRPGRREAARRDRDGAARASACCSSRSSRSTARTGPTSSPAS